MRPVTAMMNLQASGASASSASPAMLLERLDRVKLVYFANYRV
jgi:hypothetical protein